MASRRGYANILLFIIAVAVCTVVLNAFVQVTFSTKGSLSKNTALIANLNKKNYVLRSLLHTVQKQHNRTQKHVQAREVSGPDPRDLGQCKRKAPRTISLFETRGSMKKKRDAAQKQKMEKKRSKFNIYSRLLRLKKGILIQDTNSLAQRSYKRCAVVGNGGVLLNDDRNGESIDAHDAVFRINEGPTRGFEKYVGRKTTFRVHYLSTCASMSADEYAHVLCVVRINKICELRFLTPSSFVFLPTLILSLLHI